MVTKTSISALRSLLHLARTPTGEVLPPRSIAQRLGESPTYLAKVTRQLVKAGILRAERGVKGGVRLNRLPERITLLAVVEACQGTLVGDYCQQDCDLRAACSYHQAAVELRQAVVGVLSRWTLADLLKRPLPAAFSPIVDPCVMGGGKQVTGKSRRRSKQRVGAEGA